MPFLRPYRGRIAIGILALVVSSATTLALPQIAGGLIDARGLTAHEAQFLSGYYIAFLVAGAVWGTATATRFYFITWLGERVVADIRKAVFDNVLSLTPQFFEVTRTGEVLSRLTADTTLIQTVVGSSASVAARNVVNLTGGLILMFVTSPKLALLVVGAVVLVLVPMLVFGRWVRSLSRKSQDSIAETSARGGEILNAVPTVQAFTQEKYERREFGATVERAFAIASSRTLARSILTAVAIFTASASLATIALVGLHDIVTGQISGGMLVQVHYLWLPGRGRRGRLVGNLGRSATRRRCIGTADGIAA